MNEYTLAVAVLNSPAAAIDRALKSGTPSDWERIYSTFRWENWNPALLRAIAFKIYNHNAAYKIMIRIIELKVLHLEDYDLMSDKLAHPQVKWAAMHHIWEAAKEFWLFDYGKEIIKRIFPPVAYPWKVLGDDYEDPYHSVTSGHGWH